MHHGSRPERDPNAISAIVRIAETVGGTPLVERRKVVRNGSARVLVKLESHNPTGSMKDRMALAVVKAALASGANVAAALRVAVGLGPRRTVVTLICDSGLKYLSTDLYATE